MAGVDDFGTVLSLTGEKPIGRVPALNEIIRLLKLQAGDPATVDRALAYEQGDVTDVEVSIIERLRADTEAWSILFIQFSQTSGTGRYLITGGNPSAAGEGMPILSGGSQLIIRGVDNINN